MRRIKWAALLCVLLLALCGCAAASNDDIATFIQPDGVQVFALEDIGYFTAPEGLQSMYALMQSDQPFSSIYVFVMPHGRALLSLSCTEVAEAKTAQSLLDSWEAIAQNLSIPGATVDINAANVRLDTQYGFEALHISTEMAFDGTSLVLSMEGVAFYRGGDLLELWTVYPKDSAYTTDPNAQSELQQDMENLTELCSSLSFDTAAMAEQQKVDEALLADSILYDDPRGYFSLRIPPNTVVITPDTDDATVTRERTWYADANEGGDLVFDQWMSEVTKNNATLLLMHDAGLVCQVFCQVDENYLNFSVSDYQRISAAVTTSLTKQFGFCSLMSDDATAILSGLEHAWLTFWLRQGETDMLLNLYAVTDEHGRLRETDLFTMVDMDVDPDTRESVSQMLLQTMQYK